MFKGEKVRLRAIEKKDIEELVKMRNEEEVSFNLTTGIPHPFPLEAELHSFEEKIKVRRPDEMNFAIVRHDGKVIGKCGTMDTDWKNSVTTVYIFIGGDENRSKGYGSEAFSLLVDFIFLEMNINRIQLYVFGFNERAQKSYKKIGFKVEGIQRQDIFRNGKYHDCMQMAILRREYDELKGGQGHAV